MLGEIDATDTARDQRRNGALGKLSVRMGCEDDRSRRLMCGAKEVAPDESNSAVGREVGQNTDEQATCCGRITSSPSSSFRLPFDANVEIMCRTVRIANGATVDLRATSRCYVVTARTLWTTWERVQIG